MRWIILVKWDTRVCLTQTLIILKVTFYTRTETCIGQGSERIFGFHTPLCKIQVAAETIVSDLKNVPYIVQMFSLIQEKSENAVRATADYWYDNSKSNAESEK